MKKKNTSTEAEPPSDIRSEKTDESMVEYGTDPEDPGTPVSLTPSEKRVFQHKEEDSDAITVEATEEDFRELSDDHSDIVQGPMGNAPRLKSKRKRDSFRKTIQVDLTQIDHTICGPPCANKPIPPDVLVLNKEFADVFPEALPAGLPPVRSTDHKIPLKVRSRPHPAEHTA